MDGSVTAVLDAREDPAKRRRFSAVLLDVCGCRARAAIARRPVNGGRSGRDGR